MELDLYFAEAVFAFALTAFLAGVGHSLGGLLRRSCPAAFRFARGFGPRHPGLFAGPGDFYCFFHKDALYGR